GTLFVSAMPSVWARSVVAGPESFNLMLTVFSLWLLFRVHEGSSRSGALVLFWSYLMGLAFSHSYVFIFSMALLIIFLRAGPRVRRAVKENLGPMVFLFIIGTSLYLYIWLRPQLDIGLGQSPEFLSKDFWSFVFLTDTLKGSLSRRAAFFVYQVPLLLGYLKLQAGHWAVAVAALVVFHYALVRIFRLNRRLLAGMLVLLAVSALVVLWLDNPRLGPAQALDKVPETWKHEPRDLDHLFLFTYLLFGSLVVLGLYFLRQDLRALIDWSVQKMQIDGGRLHKLARGGVSTVLLVAPLAFIPLHWQRSDMSAYYVVRDLADNLLSGVEGNAILFVNNDLEYYPIVYVNKIIFKQSDKIVANYAWMQERSYLKDLKVSDPPMPFILSGDGFDRLRPLRLEKALPLAAGELRVVYPENTLLNIREQGLIDILKANEFRRPVYFSYRVPQNSMAGLQRFAAVQGLGVRLFEQDLLSGADSLNYWRREPESAAVDIRKTTDLLMAGYRFRTTVKDLERHPEDQSRLLDIYASLHEILGRGLLARNLDQEAASSFRQCEFFSRSYPESLHNFAVIMAWSGHYDGAKEFMNFYFQRKPTDPLKWAGLAKIALTNADSSAALEMLQESIKADQDFLLGFQKLIRLYDSMGQKVMASAFLSRWVGRHSNDEQAMRLWEEYSTTETLPPDWPE
ncbi:MAG: hypothetical protein JXQ83_02580, partial [Candidatus Glassbacteria bacterium]|nr:hypothetical protein [Candidatus Glassbacteria bacterium]